MKMNNKLLKCGLTIFLVCISLISLSQSFSTYNDPNGVTIGRLDNSTGIYTPISPIIGFASQQTTIDPVNGHFICLIQDLPSQSNGSLQTIDLSTGNVLHNISTSPLSNGIRHLENMNSCCKQRNTKLICSDSPNVITPNNDGINDYLQFKTSKEINLNLTVFNRWGNLVYSSKNYKNNWNGNAEKLNEGVYFYILTDENKNVCKSYLHIFND